jgi:hypothetical protein
MKLTKATAQKILKVVDAGLSDGLGNPIPGEMCVEAAVCYALGLPHSDDPKCVSSALRSLKISLNDRAWSSPRARAKGLRRLAIAQLGTADTLDDKAFLAHVVEITIKKIVPMALRSAIPLQKLDKHKEAMEAAAKRCESEGTKDAAKAAYAAANDAYAANAAANAACVADAAKAAYAAASAAYAANAAANAACVAAYAADAAYAAAYAAAAADAADAAADADAADAERDRVLSFFAEEVVQILIAMKAHGTKWLDLTEAA